MKKIYIIILLYILIVVNLFISMILYYPKYPNIINYKQIDHYTSNSFTIPLPFNYLGKKLVFTSFGDLKCLASERANYNSYIISEPVGKCINSIVPNWNSALSIVKDEPFYYIFAKCCLSISISLYEINGDLLTLYFPIDNKGRNIKNITAFILLNPLYVEFCIDSKKTCGYLIDTNLLNLQSNYNEFQITFKKINSISSCNNSLFNYDNTINPAITPKNDLISSIPQKNNERIINMLVYYLDDNNYGNFQNIGKILPIPPNLNKKIPNKNVSTLELFDKKYTRTRNTNTNTNTSKNIINISRYEFNNNLSLIYHNYLNPVFTISFNLFNVNNKTSINSPLLICNNLGLSDTQLNIDTSTNLFSVILTKYKLYSDKNQNQKFPMVNLEIQVNSNTNNKDNVKPLIIENIYTTSTITITVTPNQIYALGYWYYGSNNTKLFSYGKSISYLNKNSTHAPDNLCDINSDNFKDISNTNNLAKLFIKKNNNRISLDNLYINYNNQYVSLNEIKLGYVNYYNILNK